MTTLELEQQKATQAMEHQVAATERSHKRYRKPEKGSYNPQTEKMDMGNPKQNQPHVGSTPFPTPKHLV